jgi:hypothetical protein
MREIIEVLRRGLEEFNNYNIQFLNCEDDIEELYFGLDWLSENMKPIVE